MPFSDDEVERIRVAARTLAGFGRYGPKIEPMLLLLRYSGLRMQDAACLERTRLVDDKLFLYQLLLRGVSIEIVSKLLAEDRHTGVLSATSACGRSHFDQGHGTALRAVGEGAAGTVGNRGSQDLVFVRYATNPSTPVITGGGATCVKIRQPRACHASPFGQVWSHRSITNMLRAYGLDIPRTLDEMCDPKRMALLVYDMQVGVLRQIKNAPEITASVLRVLHAAREAGVRVIFFRHMSLPKELMGVFQFRMAMAWQRVETVEEVRPWFLRDSPGFQLSPELTPLPTEVVFDKITMSAFEGTPLNLVLRDCGINVLAIVGVAMEVGIEPTVRHAADLGYIPVIVRDACGAGHEEAAQRSIACVDYSGDAVLTDVDTICGVFKRHR